MNDQVIVWTLYDRLMAASQDAFAAGLYSAAYHALAGALHCARQLQDNRTLERIKEMATAQLAWIDENAPDYEHSSRSAQVRGHESIFYLLARQAATNVEMANQRKKQDF